MVVETKFHCDGCGEEIITESKYPNYSHFNLVPIHYINKTGWGYPMGYIRQDEMQFCRKCKNTMMLALPIKYYQCGLCMSMVKGHVGQSLKSLEEMHNKTVHPNYRVVTYDGGLSSDRCFTSNQVIAEPIFHFQDDKVEEEEKEKK